MNLHKLKFAEEFEEANRKESACERTATPFVAHSFCESAHCRISRRRH
jgi:hypothetical protein